MDHEPQGVGPPPPRTPQRSTADGDDSDGGHGPQRPPWHLTWLAPALLAAAGPPALMTCTAARVLRACHARWAALALLVGSLLSANAGAATAATAAGPGAAAGAPDAELHADPETVPAIKRLLRELFSEMLAVKQQIQDLTPKSEDEDLVLPHSGGTVAPARWPVAPGLHRKAKGQVSGTVSWTFGMDLPPAPAEGSGGSAANEFRDAPALGLASSTAGARPHIQLLVQSLIAGADNTLTARLASADETPPAAALGMAAALPSQAPPGSVAAAAAGLAAARTALVAPPLRGADCSNLALASLLYRTEAFPGVLKMCFAPLGGSLSSIARRINPWAAPGLTELADQGHGIPMVLERGRGAAVTWVPRLGAQRSDSDAGGAGSGPSVREGALSASVGQFALPGLAGTAGGAAVHTVAQLSNHAFDSGGSASLVLSSTQLPAGSAPGGAGPESVRRAGVFTTVAVLDALRLSGWFAWQLRGREALRRAAWSLEGGGVQLSTLQPDGARPAFALTAAYAMPKRSGAVGGGQASGAGAGGGGGAPSTVVVEGSVSKVVADGFSVVPGVVVVRRGASVRCKLACRVAWDF